MVIAVASGTDIVIITLECFCTLQEVDKLLAPLIRLQGARLKDQRCACYVLIMIKYIPM